MPLAADPKTRRFRRIRRFAIFAGILLVVATIGDAALGMVFRARLAATVKHGMGVDLTSRFAWYIPPYGVSLHHVRISMSQPDGRGDELLTASRVVLKLARLPAHGKPLVVTLLQIDSPAVLIRSSPAPAKPAVSTAPAVEPTPAVPPAAPIDSKPILPSEKFVIQNFKITDGQVTLDNGDEDPLVLDHIDLAFNPSPGSTGVYRFAADSDQKAPASVNGAGTVNIDDMTLGLSEITVQAKIGAMLSQAHVSGAVRHRLEMARVDGVLNIRADASVPMNDWRHSTYSADIQLASGTAALPNSLLTVDSARGQLHIQYDGGKSPVRATLGIVTADCGSSHLQIDGGKFTTLDDGKGWEISKLLGRLDLADDIPALQRMHLKGRFLFTAMATGPAQVPRDATVLSALKHELVFYPHDVSIQPPLYPIPLDHINGGPVSCRGGIVRFANLSANYGGDQLLLENAHITLDDPQHQVDFSDMHSQIRVEGIAGTLVCHQPGPEYPAGLGKVIAQLRPSGTFAVGGGSWYGINRKLPDQAARPKPDYFFRISTAGGAFALTDRKISLTDIHADANVSPMLVDIQNLRGNCVGGTLIANTKITPVIPVVYTGAGTFYNARLQTAFAQAGMTPKKPLMGTAYLKVNVSGMGSGGDHTPLQTFAADGEFQIIDGNFGDIQTIRAAASNVSKPEQNLDGEAAGIFSIRNQTVTLDNCAVGNPMFGLEGAGTIGFDRKLDLHAVAAPLGDWREGLRRSNIPALNDVASDIAGIQQLFAGAQRTLLWDIHVGGTTSAPKVEQTPAPVITKPVAAIFGQLIRGVKDDELLDQVRPQTIAK